MSSNGDGSRKGEEGRSSTRGVGMRRVERIVWINESTNINHFFFNLRLCSVPI